MVLLILSVILMLIFSIVYLLYFFLILKTNKINKYINELQRILKTDLRLDELPYVTVIIPVYNEENIMYNKIKNIADFKYPLDKIEVLLVDDDSIDNTQQVAKYAFKDFTLNGKIIQNRTRSGVNYSYNQTIPKVDCEYIFTTDADAIIPPDSLLKMVKILMALKDVGGVAAKMIPIKNKFTAATRIAVAYVNSYNSMLLAESAIFSTFPGSTSCMLMRKSAFSLISTSYGSSDGNISLSIIKKGFKFISAPCIEYYEPISQKILEQRRQKIRRAIRLIQSTYLNLDIFASSKYGEFGRIIFPLRFMMMILSPVLVLSSIVLILIFFFLASHLIFGILLAFATLFFILGMNVNIRILNLFSSFILHQTYLFIGFIMSFKKMNVWKKIERNSTNQASSSARTSMAMVQDKTLTSGSI